MTAPEEIPDRIDTPGPVGSGAVEEATAILRALVALGVRDLVIAPGSRSAPFVYALQDEQLAGHLRAHVRIDERAAAFTALGISRADPRHPGAVVTTSGTATAHLHAAVLEAHHAGVPLLVLTADRPAELRDTGANQATHQAGLYGDAVRWASDLPAPAAEGATAAELRTAVNSTARAVAAATGERPGPVHLNVGLRDPLTPRSAPGPAETPGIVVTRRVAPSAVPGVPIPLTGRTIVVAADGAGPDARAFAERHRLPLLAEPSSGARAGDAMIAGYPELLHQVMASADHPLRPDRAVVFGHPTLSRPVVSGLLGADDVDVIVVDRAGTWPDASRRARRVVPAAVGEETEEVAERQQRFLAAWRAEAPPASAGTWQARAALAVWAASGPDDVLVVGSSSTVRDLEQHAPATAATIVANRGLAGIDGMVSTASGYALARRRAAGRVRVLVGDLTALHDLTGLLIGPDEVEPELDIVVLDDDGGRIFSGLEHAAAPPAVLRRFFTTPHGVDLTGAANALGVPARLVDADGLADALVEPASGRRMLVVQESVSAVPQIP